MRKSTILGLALMACMWGADANAQAADGGYGDSDMGSMPAIILPDQLTGPITGDFHGRDGGDADLGQPEGGEETWQAPYSVEGEEPLEPESN